MRYAHRTFLWSIVPFAILLLATFWAVERSVVSTVRDGLRTSLRENQLARVQMRHRAQLQNGRVLQVVGENAALKAGLQLMSTDHDQRESQLTLEDQLREICSTIGVDFLLVSGVDGVPLAGVMRSGDEIVAMDMLNMKHALKEFVIRDGRPYHVTSVSISQSDEDIGLLSVGESIDLSEFSAPVVLLGNGKVLQSSLPGFSAEQVGASLKACTARPECELELGGETYLSLVIENVNFGDGYVLRSLQSVDRALSPVQQVLGKIFVNLGAFAFLAAVMLSALSARSIVKPIARVVSQLRESGKSGLLPEFNTNLSSVQEIRELTSSFNEAASAIRNGREQLNSAYVEFVGSLACALDARDRYTAGHSTRVSEYSCAIADTMMLSQERVDEIRIGALLHDIGKIGIADSVLQKPGKLTDQEFALIQEHPVIGRKILEGVNGLAPYLPIVELHHENWDGSGYPHGLHQHEVPLTARIVHVADAYDAMTSDRPYRRGMSQERALGILKENAGTQFDPLVVCRFAEYLAKSHPAGADCATDISLQNLAKAVDTGRVNVVVEELVESGRS